jgi:drug/metabolite transporter (DMT)-like permease
MLIGALILLAMAYGQGEHWPAAVGPREWAWFLWLAIPGSAGSFGLWFLALRKGGATRSSGYLFLAPLFTVLLSDAILKTSLTWQQAAGGVLIGLSLWLVNRGSQHSHARA